MQSQRWQDWTIIVAGLWILVSPWLLGAAALNDFMATPTTWGHGIVGIALVGLAVAAIATETVWEEWIAALLGLATISLPWVVGPAGHNALITSDVIVGLVVFVLAAATAINQRSTFG